jgi:hypothetical protein
VFGIVYDNGGASEYGADVAVSGPELIAADVKGGFGSGPVDGVVVLFGESVLALAGCDFFKCAAGLERWLAPVGFPRLTEHFWK